MSYRDLITGLRFLVIAAGFTAVAACKPAFNHPVAIGSAAHHPGETVIVPNAGGLAVSTSASYKMRGVGISGMAHVDQSGGAYKKKGAVVGDYQWAK